MKASVVINTYNRGRSLRQTLRGLRYQTFDDFEVVVVNGPSTDETEAVLAEFSDLVRVASCPEIHISRSRNIGIGLSSGDVVAFIDDDSIPDPRWLDGLAAGYDSERVGGVGGIVYDHTGYALQYSNCVCDRRGNARFDLKPPLWAYQLPQGDAFAHLLGTNCSFRRSCLVEVGGFDEEIEYYLDETELCMRILDRGYWVRELHGAPVYHKFLASHLRNDKKVLRKPFPVVKNKYYFSLRAARPHDSVDEILDDCQQFVDKLTQDTRWAVSAGRLSEEEFAVFERDVQAAARRGIEQGLYSERKSATLSPPLSENFRRFSTLRPQPRRLNLCFVSQEMPPESWGGIGRFTLDLAQGLAAEGHEIHLITRSPDHNRVDFEEGVWVHRIVSDTEGSWCRPDLGPTVRKNLGRAAAVHREILRVGQDRPIDLVSAPVWDFEGLFCQLDDSLATVLTLHTTMKTVADMNPSWSDSPEMGQLIALERYTVRTARHVTAPSQDVLEKVRRDYGAPFPPIDAYVIPHGIPDVAVDSSRGADGRVRVLFVGRLEVRKGVDLLLGAADRLVREYPEVEFVLVGDDTIRHSDGSTYRADFEARHAGDPAGRRVVFAGVVSESELSQNYADCDIFCLPARYESFGLVFIEAMRFGKPVIGCAAGGMPEVIEHGVNGFLFPEEDVDSLTEFLRRLVESPELRREFGLQSRKRYEREFSVETMVSNTLRAYSEIIASAVT